MTPPMMARAASTPMTIPAMAPPEMPDPPFLLEPVDEGEADAVDDAASAVDDDDEVEEEDDEDDDDDDDDDEVDVEDELEEEDEDVDEDDDEDDDDVDVDVEDADDELDEEVDDDEGAALDTDAPSIEYTLYPLEPPQLSSGYPEQLLSHAESSVFPLGIEFPQKQYSPSCRANTA